MTFEETGFIVGVILGWVLGTLGILIAQKLYGNR